MKFRNVSFLIALSLVSVSALAAEKQSYDLSCTHNATKYNTAQFRLTGRYEVAEDGSATLSGVRGVVYDNENLTMLEVYSEKELANDEKYKAKGQQWQDHVRFIFKKSVGPSSMSSSGGNTELILALEPDSHKDRRVKDVPNPGTERISQIHAGIQVYLSDVGDRIPVNCTGYQYFPDREKGK